MNQITLIIDGKKSRHTSFAQAFRHARNLCLADSFSEEIIQVLKFLFGLE